MEYSKLSELGAYRIGEVLGYDIYAPKYMADSPFLYKKNSIQWILLDKSGTCVKYILKKSDYAEEELSVFIRENL